MTTTTRPYWFWLNKRGPKQKNFTNFSPSRRENILLESDSDQKFIMGVGEENSLNVVCRTTHSCYAHAAKLNRQTSLGGNGGLNFSKVEEINKQKGEEKVGSEKRCERKKLAVKISELNQHWLLCCKAKQKGTNDFQFSNVLSI